MNDTNIKSKEFSCDLSWLLHAHHIGQDLDTANFILAEYLIDCLENLYNTMDRRACDKDASKYLEAL